MRLPGLSKSARTKSTLITASFEHPGECPFVSQSYVGAREQVAGVLVVVVVGVVVIRR